MLRFLFWANVVFAILNLLFFIFGGHMLNLFVACFNIAVVAHEMYYAEETA